MIVRCPNCGQKNRVAAGRFDEGPVCGNGGERIDEPEAPVDGDGTRNLSAHGLCAIAERGRGGASAVERRDTSVTTDDGVELAATVYRPVGEPGAAVVINSAMAVHRRNYDDFAGGLAGEGFAVVTYDYRGVGRSPSGDLVDCDASIFAPALTHLFGYLPWSLFFGLFRSSMSFLWPRFLERLESAPGTRST